MRFGLIGCGAAGKIHALAMHESKAVELVMVADVEPRAAAALGARFAVPWTDEVERLLADRSIEAVSIAVPHFLHVALARQALLAGKHVLLEKPFTTSRADGEALVALAAGAGLCLAPWLERRYLPWVDRAREIVASGTLGRLVYTRVCALGYKPRAYWQYGMRCEEYPSDWRGHLATSGGGILLMNGIHQIDLMAYVSGLQAEEVQARIATLHHEVEVEDLATVSLRYRGGALGSVEASCCTYGMNEFPIEAPADTIMGDDGHLELGTRLRSFDRVRFQRVEEFARLSVTEMKARELADFAAHVREGTPMRCSPADALAALELITTAYAAARAGRSLPLAGGAGSR